MGGVSSDRSSREQDLGTFVATETGAWIEVDRRGLDGASVYIIGGATVAVDIEVAADAAQTAIPAKDLKGDDVSAAAEDTMWTLQGNALFIRATRTAGTGTTVVRVIYPGLPD